MRREVESLRPLFFPEHLLSGIDNGGDVLIKAQSGLISIRNHLRLQRGLAHVLDLPLQISNQGWKWAILDENIGAL
jgi:hypothetical protein